MVSIIIPFYNVELYFDRCLKSIAGQTYADLEVLLVNDGSQDNCRNIALAYQVKDKRFKLIDRENGGLSAARNTGLKHASGKYIVFVDSDDWAEPTFIEELVQTIERDDSDLACCRLQYVDIKTGIKSIYGKSFHMTCMHGKQVALDALLVKNIHTPVWAKIYRRTFLSEHNIDFYEGIVNEDTLFTTLVTLNAKKVSFCDKVLFNSLERPGSISRSSQEKLFRDMHIAMNEIKSYMQANGFGDDKDLTTAYCSRYVKGMLYNLLQSAQRLPKSKFMEMHALCFEETEYTSFLGSHLMLPIPHKCLYYLSLYPNLFYTAFKIMRACGFKMH